MKGLISVIVPVYNVEKYLSKCVDSCINQTYRNLEIILIDDGSTDGSGDICDEYSRLDERVVVVHQKNQGLSVARNTGIDISKGEWIGFVDSDDWIEPDFFEILYSLVNTSNADICSCQKCLRYDENPIDNSDTNRITKYGFAELIKGLLPNDKNITFVVWNKIWKRSLIGDVRFKQGQVCEDVAFDRQLFLRTNGLVHIDKTLYNYRQNRFGNTNTSFKLAKMCVIDEFKMFINDLEERNEYELADVIAEVAAVHLMNYYKEAWYFNQSKEIKKRIHDAFRLFYKRVESNASIVNWRTRIFRVFPDFYYWLVSLKSKI